MDSSYNFERMTTLVVDSNAHMRAILSAILQGFGIGEIVQVSNSTSALQILRGKSIDLIICEYQLSPLDGLELSKTIRTSEDSLNPMVPLLMLTAHSEIEKVKSARDAGVTDFMVKPVSATGLYERIVKIVEQPRQFVRNREFSGPDRRRQSGADFEGKDRRPGRQGDRRDPSDRRDRRDPDDPDDGNEVKI